MAWDPAYTPHIRPVEAVPLTETDGVSVALVDRSGLSTAELRLSQAALHVLSLMDGTRTCTEIQSEIQTLFGQPLAADTLQNMIDHLERAHFLQGEAFETYYRTLVEDYRTAGLRPMRDAEALGITDDSGRLFDEMLEGCEPTAHARTIVGLVAPHLDYPRGRPCYAAAYGALRNRTVPDRVVLLGTNHFGRSASVVGTASDFATPLGTTRTDVAFLERIEAACGDLRAHELDHAREHSIELQIAWLQHLFGAENFEVVPFLCPDPCGPTGTAPYGGEGVDLRAFAETLGRLVGDDPSDTLIVAGADLSHVGTGFGPDPELDEAFLSEVRQTDHDALGRLLENGPEAFIQSVAESENPTRICSMGCIFALATALPDAKPAMLRYHQAVDESTRQGVTCTAIVFT